MVAKKDPDFLGDHQVEGCQGARRLSSEEHPKGSHPLEGLDLEGKTRIHGGSFKGVET